MKTRNEIKIGVAVAIVTGLFVFGTRYLQDKPFFSGKVRYLTTFSDAGGLVTGNAVRVNGVPVGSVTRISLVEGDARIEFSVSASVPLTEGTTAAVGGAALLGVTRLNLILGPDDGVPYEHGDHIPSVEGDDLGQILGSAPALIERTDSLIAGTTQTLESARGLIDNPDGNLQGALAAIEQTANEITVVLQAERDNLAGVLKYIRDAAGSFDTLARDSLAVTAARLNALLSGFDQNLELLKQTTLSLNTLIAKLNSGEGSLGRLINEDSLYIELHGALRRINQILEDFENDPKKYLKDLTLVDIL